MWSLLSKCKPPPAGWTQFKACSLQGGFTFLKTFHTHRNWEMRTYIWAELTKGNGKAMELESFGWPVFGGSASDQTFLWGSKWLSWVDTAIISKMGQLAQKPLHLLRHSLSISTSCLLISLHWHSEMPKIKLKWSDFFPNTFYDLKLQKHSLPRGLGTELNSEQTAPFSLFISSIVSPSILGH